MTAEEFNEKYPVGSSFIYQAVKYLRGGIPVQTRSEAWELGHGEAVVKVTDKAGGVSIEHLTPA